MRKLLALIFLSSTLNLMSQSKIGFVDFQYIVTQVKSSSDIQLELQKLATQWTDQITAMKDSVQLLEKELETISITLTRTGRDVLEKRVRDGKQKIQTFQDQKFSPVSGELYKKQQELLQPLVDKIRKAIDNVRMKEKFDVVFDVSAGNPVSIDRKYDLTTLVLEELTNLGLPMVQQAVETTTTSPTSDRRGTGSGAKKLPGQPQKPPKEGGQDKDIDQ